MQSYDKQIGTLPGDHNKPGGPAKKNGGQMGARETIETIERLNDQDWERMKKHMDEKFPNMKVPDMKSFKELVKIYGMMQQRKELN